MSTLAKPWAVYVRERSGFQVVVRAQYAYEAFTLARPQLAESWPGLSFADCVVVDEEERLRELRARKVGAERGSVRP